ncbi:hypothetical protein AVDCRST_MAG84-5041 [uncultured Microcoleus sp.]|uniref:Uncharacterized protein n=1 Tax=uncultured Microcoleus sp. TaxID=259945 RepID=A0A6J4NEC7_9CYAN|nr:hypothetical protein AVDCRST_MAG84-5041 [uncultured Microcoleus sp.]
MRSGVSGLNKRYHNPRNHTKSGLAISLAHTSTAFCRTDSAYIKAQTLIHFENIYLSYLLKPL